MKEKLTALLAALGVVALASIGGLADAMPLSLDSLTALLSR